MYQIHYPTGSHTNCQKLALVEIVIDKMHTAGHVDKWCLINCDPHRFSELGKIS